MIIFVGLILLIMIYAVIDLLRYTWKVRNWNRKGEWDKYAF